MVISTIRINKLLPADFKSYYDKPTFSAITSRLDGSTKLVAPQELESVKREGTVRVKNEMGLRGVGRSILIIQ